MRTELHNVVATACLEGRVKQRPPMTVKRNFGVIVFVAPP